MFSRFNRRGLLAMAFSATIVSAMLPTQAFAFDDTSASAVNVDKAGVGLRGHDPVAYFTVGAPTMGKPAFTASHGGTTYQFASAANRDAFVAAPAKYAPQYGGFCAMGVALNKKFDGDPAAWHVENGKLYLNLNKDVQKSWLSDVSGHLKKSDTSWPQIKDKAPKAL